MGMIEEEARARLSEAIKVRNAVREAVVCLQRARGYSVRSRFDRKLDLAYEELTKLLGYVEAIVIECELDVSIP
jgi:hypothetical protein